MVSHQRVGDDRRYVLLDRDGTLNVEHHYLLDPDAVELMPGVVEGLRRLRALGMGLVVVTNQSAIGRGILDQTCLKAIHRRLCELLAEGGVELDGIYYCPHRPVDNCACRKPKPGLAYQAAGVLGFDPRRAFVIGDNTCDIELGRRLGATTLLVRTGHGAEVATRGEIDSDYIVEDLAEAASVIERLVGLGSCT